jgi:hypothetical protein
LLTSIKKTYKPLNINSFLLLFEDGLLVAKLDF